MRVAPGLMVGMLLAAGAMAAEPPRATATATASGAVRPEFEPLILELEARARQLYPRRRDTPLRYLNITDSEVREVQQVARKHKMPRLVNISPVVTGCPCEEGGGCTEQVFIVGDVEGTSTGLMLSRRKNQWDIGRVQKWWLEYAALQAREGAMERRVFLTARARLLMEMPQCVTPGESADKPDAKPVALAETQTQTQTKR
jgi:hypothetical protein